MNIVLNSELKEIHRNPSYPYSNDPTNLIRRLGNKLEPRKSYHDPAGYQPVSMMDITNIEHIDNGFLGALSNAYSMHRKILINPQDLWYIVLCEMAEVIKANTELCRPLFTKSADKVNISVPTDDITEIDLSLVMEQLKELVPVDTNIFCPELSTLDDNARMALYAALCDGLQHFYSYSTFCCGIPEIRLGGTATDWKLLLQSTAEIAGMFKSIGFGEVVEWMVRVGDVLANIIKSIYDDAFAVEFFTNIFTQKNVGSGGELEISGWITDLYYAKRKMPKLENFETSIAIVPYKNLDTGLEFKAIHGAFKRRVVEGFVTVDYDSVVFQKV